MNESQCDDCGIILKFGGYLYQRKDFPDILLCKKCLEKRAKKKKSKPQKLWGKDNEEEKDG